MCPSASKRVAVKRLSAPPKKKAPAPAVTHTPLPPPPAPKPIPMPAAAASASISSTAAAKKGFNYAKWDKMVEEEEERELNPPRPPPKPVMDDGLGMMPTGQNSAPVRQPEEDLNDQQKQLKSMSEGFDMAEYQKNRIKELEMQKQMMGSGVVDQNLEAEHLMRNAKQQGNQGNLVMDKKTGKMVLKSADDMGGKAATYWWGQTDNEVTIKCHVASSIKSKAVKLTTTSTSVKLIVDGATICNGPLLRQIISDESTWSLEDVDSETRLLTVTMQKATPTRGQDHWTCAIKGEAKISKDNFGIATTTVNPNDPEEMKRVLESLK